MQTYLCKKAASYLSKELKTKVSVGGIDIAFFFDVVLEDLLVEDLHGKVLLKCGRFKVDVKDVHYKEKKINIGILTLSETDINIRKYKSGKDFNFQFIADYFSSTDTTTSAGKKWQLSCRSLCIKKSNLIYQDLNKQPVGKIIDFNNIGISDLNITVKNITTAGDTVYADIKDLSFLEKSGFRLDKFNTNLKITGNELSANTLLIKTGRTSLDMDLKFCFNSLDDFNDFINNVRIYSAFRPSIVYLEDIAYFSSDMRGMDDIVKIGEGEVSGRINNLKGKDFSFCFGKDTRFLGSFTFTGLPDIEETFVHFNIKSFIVTDSDIASFCLPSDSTGKNRIPVPKELVKLGKIRIKGFFTGFYNDFVACSDFYTNIGNISTNISLKGSKINEIEYKGKLTARDLDIERIAPDSRVKNASFSFNITGKGLSEKSMKAQLSGKVDSIRFNNYNYRNIDISGRLENENVFCDVNINDENIGMKVSGTADFSADMPAFKFYLSVNDAKLDRLNLIDRKSNPELSANIHIDMAGNSIDNISGDVEINNVLYKEGDKKISMQKLSLNTARTGEKTNIELNSDFLECNINGIFSTGSLYSSFSNMFEKYLAYKKEPAGKNKTSEPPLQDFSYKITLKDVQPICNIFIPGLKIASRLNITGNYNSYNYRFVLEGKSNYISYNDKLFNSYFIKINSDSRALNINTGCERLFLSDSLWLDNLVLNSVVEDDSIKYNLLWDNNKTKNNNSGNIIGSLSFVQTAPVLNLSQAKVVFNDSAWTAGRNNSIVFDSASIVVNDLYFRTGNQEINISGVISDESFDKLRIRFKNFNVSNIDILTKEQDFDIDGIMNGNVELFDMFSSPNFISNITVKDFTFNESRLGDAVVQSTWDKDKKGLGITAEVIYTGSIGSNKPVSITGYYYPLNKDDVFDLDISIDNIKLNPFSDYLSSFGSELKGNAIGKLKLRGSPAEPELTGKLKLFRTGLKIDYLNTTYTFAHEVKVYKDRFEIDSLVLNDMYGNAAICDGEIKHKNFRDFRFNFEFRPKNFLCLNTNEYENSMFYGTAFGSGKVRIYGDVKNITMDIDMKTGKGSQFNIPLNSTEEVSENNFISFIKKDTGSVKGKEADNNRVDLSGITLNFNLEVTPDAEVRIIFDSKVGDIMKGRGKGNIKMDINTDGDLSMFGDYVIEEGEYLLTLQNVINKRFKINKGGTLKWKGDPYDADINIEAVYNVKTSLDVLINSEQEKTGKRVPVDCIIKMTNRLLNPVIEFAIDFPTLGDFEKEQYMEGVRSDLNKQVFSLLVLNSFTTPPRYDNSGKGYNFGVGANSSELLSNQLSNWLSQISNDFDIGVNYRPGDEISNKEIEVALSTQLFNDRVIIDGNVGSQTGVSKNENTSSIVGDVNIEYKITPEGRFRLKTFNRANNNNLLDNITSQYTQGVGVFYRKDFDSFGELFRRKSKE